VAAAGMVGNGGKFWRSLRRIDRFGHRRTVSRLQDWTERPAHNRSCHARWNEHRRRDAYKRVVSPDLWDRLHFWALRRW